MTTGRDEGGGVCVSVQDCGVGFSPEDGERLFEAFYTTKAQGEGDRPLRQPLDHRAAPRASVGHPQRGAGCHIRRLIVEAKVVAVLWNGFEPYYRLVDPERPFVRAVPPR
ncbi:MAG: hypothetical protein ACREOF_02615 [Gemmatimonadales bacterium]